MRRLLVTSSAVLLLASAASGQVSTGRVAGPLMNAPSPGTIMGYVYWDGNAVKHSPANDCGGLSVTVSAGGAALGTFSTGHFAYIPNSGTFSVCAYTVNQMPVGQNLQVRVNVTAPAAFSPAVAVSGAGAINIMGGTAPCNNLPPAVPSAADLSRNWWTCPNYAYNVNFILSAATGLVGANRTAVGKVPPGGAPTASSASGTQGTLLAPGGQKTLLGPQGNSSTDGGRSNLPAVQQPTDGGKSAAAPPAAGDGGGKSSLPAVQRSAIEDGTLNSGRQIGSGGAVGPSQTMSAPGNSPASTPPMPQTQATAMTSASGSSPAVPGSASSAGLPSTVNGAYVAAACAGDPSFRILGVSGAPDGKTLTVGPQYTIWGCSFGTAGLVKAPTPANSPSQNRTQAQAGQAGVAIYSTPFKVAWFVYATIDSWSDNAISIQVTPSEAVYRGQSVAGMDLPAGLWVTRADGETRMYWQLFFKPEQSVPPGTNPNGGGRLGQGGKSGVPAVAPSAAGDGGLNGGKQIGSGGMLGPGQTMSATGSPSTSPAPVPQPGTTATVTQYSNPPKLPVIKSNPQRDASRPADAATKAAIKSKVEMQIAAFRKSTATSTNYTPGPAAENVREIQLFKSQKIFVESLRNRAGVVQLNSVPPQSSATANATGATTSGALATGGVLLSDGNKPMLQQAPSSAAPHQQASGPTGTATAPVQSTPTGLPAERQAPTSAAQTQTPAAPDARFIAAANAKVFLNPEIYSVNGIYSSMNASSPVVFTQDPAYNDYVITGCGFGTQEGGQVYLSGAVTGGRIDMTVLQWTPTMIEAEVKPGLTGVLDGWPDLIVVPPGGGASAKFPNCRFYAQRQSVLLPGIPQSYAHLASVQVGDSTHGGGTMYCPGPDLGHLFPCISFNGGPPLDGVTNEPADRGLASTLVSNAVDRDGGQMQFNSGEDVYDLGYLAPGFVIDNFFADWYAWSASVCKGWAAQGLQFGDSLDYSTEGRYQFYQKGTQIVVDWGVDNCALRWLGTKIFGNDEYNSGYSLTVYVKGPIGVNPWTGHP